MRCKHRQAGGVGLNLTTANHVIHFDRCWNPAKEAQAGGPKIFLTEFGGRFFSCSACVSEATDRANLNGVHRSVFDVSFFSPRKHVVFD